MHADVAPTGEGVASSDIQIDRPTRGKASTKRLFDALRQLRREIAAERAVPAYIVFGDATLREMARQRPSTLPALLEVRGVGQQKLADFGEQFIDGIVDLLPASINVGTDVAPSTAIRRNADRELRRQRPTANAVQSFPLFDQGLSVEQVAERIGRAASTVFGYLESYIRHRQVRDVSPWLNRAEFELVESAIQDVGSGTLASDLRRARWSSELTNIFASFVASIENSRARARSSPSDQVGRFATN